MPYIGRSSEFAVRTVFTYTPSAGDTSISGADVDGKPLSFIDGRYAEVYLNGVKLKLDTDYNTNTTNTIAGLAALAASDEVEIVVYDAFTTSDTVSATNGGTFTGVVKFDGGINDNLTIKNSSTADNTFPLLTLQTGETDVAADDVLGAISFQAPDEGTGTDAILVAADIRAISEGDFSSSNNATSLQFLTAASAAVGTGGGRMIFNSSANLLIKDLDTADGSSPTITLQTGDTDIAADDVLGRINFQAPDEGAGTDAILVAASIQAVSEGDFSASNNATSVVIHTGESEAAESDGGGKFTFDSFGQLFLKNTTNADNSVPALRLETGDTDIAADDMLGRIMFSAPDEGAGTDAILTSAEIRAVSEGDFSSSNNATSLEFLTGASETATVKFRISSLGELSTPTAGTSNVRFGVNAGKALLSGGNDNVLVGDNAGTALTTGDFNTAVGKKALEADTLGRKSVAIGASALVGQNQTTAVDTYNTAVGTFAGESISTGIKNTIVGGLALDKEDKGNFSTAIGYATLTDQDFATDTNANNTAVGYAAGGAITIGVANTFVGSIAGDILNDADDNVAVGYSALTSDTLGHKSTAIGRSALAAQNFTTASDSFNTAVGYRSGAEITNGQSNTIIGHNAGEFVTTGAANTFVGSAAGTGITGAKTTGSNNTAVGSGAGEKIQGAANANSFMGKDAGVSLTTGTQNTGIGADALKDVTTASNNTALGVSALQNTTGSLNVGLGITAGIGITSGSGNISIGYNSCVSTVTGGNNTVVGRQAGGTLQSGIDNVLLGRETNVDNEGRDLAVALGAGVGTFAADSSFRVIGAGGVYNTGNTSAWNQTSDERIKKNIADSTIGLAEINQIKVRTFEYRTPDEITDSDLQAYDKTQIAVDKSGTQIGCVAQELATVIPSAVIEDDRGVKVVQPDEINWHMIKAVQELSTALDAALARIKTLEDG